MATNAAAHTGYLWEEKFMWHNAGPIQNASKGLQPLLVHFENAETKRRMHNLLEASGLSDSLVRVRARHATERELHRVHCAQYTARIKALSADSSKTGHKVGHEAVLSPGGYEIATLAAGGAIALVDAVLDGNVRNGYGLVRPPGHHAERDQGMGFCIFNNVAVAAAHALDARGLRRVAVVDYDVHHGNGTQQIFYEDDRVLMISLHQDGNYPLHSGGVEEVGAGAGEGYTINVPLPPGSGGGAYRAAFDRVVAPALDAFQPQLVLVSSGFDGSFMDPLASMMLTSEDFRYMVGVVMAAAERSGAGVVAMHEGGYSEYYVPFCGLAVMEQLAGSRTGVQDPSLEEGSAWGYQALQPWQDAVLQKCEVLVERLRSRTAASSGGGGGSSARL